MKTPTANSLAKWIGLALGVSLVAVAVGSWRIPTSAATLGADVKLVATPPGELELSQDGPVASGRALKPGRGQATGRLSVHNITGRRLALSVRALPSNRDLDPLMRLELRSRGRVVASGTLGELRRWSGRGLELARGERARLEARMWIPRGAGRGYEGRITDVTLEFRAPPGARSS